MSSRSRADRNQGTSPGANGTRNAPRNAGVTPDRDNRPGERRHNHDQNTGWNELGEDGEEE